MVAVRAFKMRFTAFVDDSTTNVLNHSATFRHKPSDDLLQPKSIVLFYNAENLINKKKKIIEKI